MKKYILRFSLVLVVWVLSLPVQSWLRSLQDEYSRPVRFFLAEPFHGRVVRQAALKPGDRVLRVVLAGRFSNWALDDPRFFMKRSANGWSYSIRLEPGEHPYKFILTVLRKGQWKAERVWVNDPRESRRTPDSFGGYNSVHVVRSTANAQNFIRFLVLTLAFGAIMLTLLEVVIRRVLFFRFSLKYKLVIVFLLFLLLSNIFYVFYMSRQQRQTLMYTRIDMINMFHIGLLRDGVDFRRLGEPQTSRLVKDSLERFFGHARLRQDYNTLGNARVQMVRVTVLDRKGKMLATAAEKTSRDLYLGRLNGEKGLEGFLRHVARRAVRIKGESAAGGLVAVNVFDLFTKKMREEWGYVSIRRDRSAVRFFPYNLYLYPIRGNMEILGYYLFEINSESYSGLLGGMLRLNLLYLIIILGLYFFLMKYAGEIILRPINMVVEGINHIRSGDYTYQIWISTNDELDNLGKVYNYTRKKLHYTRKELEHYTEHLESVVEDRARELNRAYKILKEDLFLAKRIQKNLLSGEIRETRGVDVSVVYQPLGEVGGDFYNIHEVGVDHIRIFLADATGHGVQAALVTMLIKSEYEKMKDAEDPVAIMQRMNTQFVTTYSSLTVFFTGVIVDIDMKHRELRYVAAGHPAQYVLSGDNIIRLFERGKMIGVVPDPVFPVQTVPIRDEDRLVLFTDGIFEQFNPEGDEMGENLLFNFLERLASEGLAKQDVSEITGRILRRGDEFREGSEMNDDITLICAGFRKHKPGLPLLKPGKSKIKREGG